jgi:hypothetical protein
MGAIPLNRQLAEIARPGYSEAPDEDPPRAAEAVGMVISDLPVATAAADFRAMTSYAVTQRRCRPM